MPLEVTIFEAPFSSVKTVHLIAHPYLSTHRLYGIHARLLLKVFLQTPLNLLTNLIMFSQSGVQLFLFLDKAAYKQSNPIGCLVLCSQVLTKQTWIFNSLPGECSLTNLHPNHFNPSMAVISAVLKVLSLKVVWLNVVR